MTAQKSGRARPARTAAESAIFLDPSGRRWRRLRIVATVLLAGLLGAFFLVGPHLVDTPALNVMGERLAPALTSATTGRQLPLVGEGPLVRVLEVRRVDGKVLGFDPFTDALEATFTPSEQKRLGYRSYVIQRFGYSSAAHRTISLTFDDGPDAKWTPELLNVLAAEKVPATFFATGTMIARNPGIVQREVREGHAVANHTLSHVDLTSAPSWRARLELTLTDHVTRAVIGEGIGYVRPPYEGDDVPSTRASLDGLLRAQRYGYLVTSHDFDSND